MTEACVSALGGVHSMVVKVGSSLIIGDGAGVRQQWLHSLAADIAAQARNGVRVVVVTSGAVALGQPALGIAREDMHLAQKQAAAAAGQVLLLQAWKEALSAQGIDAAQVLLTPGDTANAERCANACATLDALHASSLIAVINENDTVATDELRYGDNDQLAARVAVMTNAQLLVLLSDVEGLFDADPHTSAVAQHIAMVTDVDSALAQVGSDAQSTHGTGGMRSKLLAARLARHAAVDTIIASGIGDHPLRRLQSGARCTRIVADPAAVNSMSAGVV